MAVGCSKLMVVFATHSFWGSRKTTSSARRKSTPWAQRELCGSLPLDPYRYLAMIFFWFSREALAMVILP